MPDLGSDHYTQGRLNVNGYTTSNIERSGDRDWFRIHLNQGQRVHFDLEGSPTGRDLPSTRPAGFSDNNNPPVISQEPDDTGD